MKTMTTKIGEDFKTWLKGNCIILNGSTGSGKTHFILNTLSPFAEGQSKRVLFLCSREELLNDIQSDIKDLKLQNIDATTYQGIQNKYNRGKVMDLDYDYVVYDECHYLAAEGWNENTDIIYNFFKDNLDRYIHIFMSGTGQNVFSWLKRNKSVTSEYIIPYSYHYVEKLVFFYENSTVEQVFESLADNEKAIFFSRSLERAYELFTEYQDKANFICSKYSKYKEHTQDCIKTYNRNLITFDKQILIATTALDVGVTIKDKRIKYIITDLLDIDSLQQSLGRKRIVDDEDACIFYIKKYNKKSLNGFLTTLQNKILVDADEYYNHREKFIEQRRIKRVLESNKCFYFSNNELDSRRKENSKIGEINFNYWTYYHYKLQEIKLEKAKDKGFDKLVLEQLGSTIKNVEYMEPVEQVKKLETLEGYLDSIIDKELWKEQQKELIDKIDLRDSRNRQQKSYELFNTYFSTNKMPYSIISVQDKRKKLVDGTININFNKTYWMVQKLVLQNNQTKIVEEVGF